MLHFHKLGKGVLIAVVNWDKITWSYHLLPTPRFLVPGNSLCLFFREGYFRMDYLWVVISLKYLNLSRNIAVKMEKYLRQFFTMVTLNSVNFYQKFDQHHFDNFRGRWLNDLFKTWNVQENILPATMVCSKINITIKKASRDIGECWYQSEFLYTALNSFVI